MVGEIVAELITAGIEGGSKRAVEEEWSLDDYRDQLRYWRRSPPPHVSLALIAKSHGAKFDEFDEPPESGPREFASAPTGGLSIEEIAKRVTPPADLSSDSTAASREALRLLAEAQ